MDERLKKKLEALDIFFVETSQFNLETCVKKEDVEELLNSITKGDYCKACGGGLSLSRHDD